MVTTVIAIYSAIVATGSVALTGWIHLASGPNLQARAELWPPLSEGDIWTIDLQVWNAGRQAIKVDIGYVLLWYELSKYNRLTGTLKRGGAAALNFDWEGPSFPIMMASHSGERWYGSCDIFDEPDKMSGPDLERFKDALQSLIAGKLDPRLLKVSLEVGGKRSMEVSVEYFRVGYRSVVRDDGRGDGAQTARHKSRRKPRPEIGG